MDKLKQIDKLLQVKELRRRLAELEAIKARKAMLDAQYAVEQARQNEQLILEDSDKRRHKRIKTLMQENTNPALQNARLANVYAITDEEIANSKQLSVTRMTELSASQECVKIEQAKLARFLQLEERTKKLCERLVEIKQTEAARIG